MSLKGFDCIKDSIVKKKYYVGGHLFTGYAHNKFFCITVSLSICLSYINSTLLGVKWKPNEIKLAVTLKVIGSKVDEWVIKAKVNLFLVNLRYVIKCWLAHSENVKAHSFSLFSHRYSF
jgi:hypothetical protein